MGLSIKNIIVTMPFKFEPNVCQIKKSKMTTAPIRD